jgi:hypothetical protein
MKFSWTKIKRNTDDPLIRTFIDKYNLHLLSIPRANVGIGDLYRYDGRQVSYPGKISYFLDPLFEISNITSGEKMADISGTTSKKIDTNFGLEFLETFLISLGAEGIVNKVRNSYQSKNTFALKFRFTDLTRDYIDPYWLSEEISNHTIKKESAMYGEGYRYFLVTAVVRSPSISIVAEDEKSRAIDIEAQSIIQLANISADVSIEKLDHGEITFRGKDNLVFGVELHELLYDTKDNRFRFNTFTETIKLRAKDSIITRTGIKPVFIGDRDNDDVFLSVVEK